MVEEKINYLQNEIKRQNDWFSLNKTAQEIQYGFYYEDNKDTALEDFYELCYTGNRVDFIKFFFEARYCGKLLNFNIGQLKVYQEKSETLQNINDIEINTADFEHFSHRVALLHKLGIIEHLRKQYNLKANDNRVLVSILTDVMGIEDKKDIKNLKIYVSAIETNSKNNPVKSEKAKSFLRETFAKLGLPTD